VHDSGCIPRRIRHSGGVDISIAEVAEQYLEYLELMRELNLDVAGEYLLMAATLAWIKSRMLLPPDPRELEEEGGDPRAELVARLLEYQVCSSSSRRCARPCTGRARAEPPTRWRSRPSPSTNA
jgi:segregation and condensation protein A